MKVYQILNNHYVFSSLNKMMKWASDSWLKSAADSSHYHYFRSICSSPFTPFESGFYQVVEISVNNPEEERKGVSVEELRKHFDKYVKSAFY